MSKLNSYILYLSERYKDDNWVAALDRLLCQYDPTRNSQSKIIATSSQSI